MGSFNVAGTMSNLSISPGDKVVFIPLASKHFKSQEDRLVKKVTNLISNSGASMFFYPRFLPIVGEYADYGSIQDIEHNENIQYIEEYFGVSIDDFMRQITINQWGREEIKCVDNDKTKELYELSGMFELYSVYQEMVKFNKQQNRAIEKMRANTKALELMGFKRSPKKTGDPRFSKYYAHPYIENYAVFSDGEYSNFIETKTGVIYCLYSPQEIMDFFPDIQFSGVNKLKGHCIHSVNVEAAIKAVLEIQRLELEHGENAWVYVKKKPEDFCWQLREWEKLFYPIEKDAVWLKEAFVDLLNFDSAMYSTNNFYYPAMNGEQFGNHHSSKVLCESSLHFIEQRLAKEWKDDTL